MPKIVNAPHFIVLVEVKGEERKAFIFANKDRATEAYAAAVKNHVGATVRLYQARSLAVSTGMQFD